MCAAPWPRQARRIEAFSETRFRRLRRQAVAVARAIRAGRARATAAAQVPQVDGAVLRDLVAEEAAGAQFVDIPVNRSSWTSTSVQVAAGEQLTWLAWGFAHIIALEIGGGPRNLLCSRVSGGAVQQSTRDTLTFTADRAGQVELASVFPGEMQQVLARR